MKAKRDKWLRWMTLIEEDVRQLLIANRMHHEIVKIVAANSDLPTTSDLYGHLGRTYTSHMVIGIRRQLKAGDGQASLVALFNELIDQPQIIDRTFFRSLYGKSGFPDADFSNFARDGDDCIDPSRVEADLKLLRDKTDGIEHFADRRVAHSDSRAPRKIPTYVELDDAVKVLDTLCVKYLLLLRAQGTLSLLPTRQYDWTRVLEMPWIKPIGKRVT